MTLGNSQPPLTRRQAREAAQAVESALPVEPSEPKPAPLATAPTVRASRSGDGATASRSLSRRELRALTLAETADAADAADGLGSEAAAVDEPAPAPHTTVPTSDTVDSSGLNPPVGHWSINQEDHETSHLSGPTQSLDDLVALGVGAGGIPTTTNALILPSVPNQGTTSGPLTSTGEILITGSFDLPRSLGETGQHPNHFDSADVDQMMDQLEESGSGNNAPVSASRAVSTHASTRNVMTPPKKRGVSLPVVLVISTAALAVSAGALLFVGHLLQVF